LQIATFVGFDERRYAGGMARPISRLFVFPILAAFQFGCDPYPEYSDHGQWEIDVSLPNDVPGLERPSRVLVGSRIFVELLGRRGDDGDYVRLGAELRECVHVFGNGTVQWIEDPPEDYTGPHGVVGAAGPGSIGISAPREACPEYEGPAQDFVRDEWTIVGVEPADTRAWWQGGYENYVLANAIGGPEDFPSAIGKLHDPLQVADGGRFTLNYVLTQEVDGEEVEVRHNRVDGEWVLPEAQQSWTEEPYFKSLEAGEQVDSSLIYGDDEIVLPTLEGVPVDRIASLELVAVYDRDQTGKRDWGLPMGVIALAHDAEGRRILGAPVEWSVTRGLVSKQPVLEASDLLVVHDSCRAEPLGKDQREATIEARLGELVASVDLEWTALREDDMDIDPDSPNCEGSACDCSTTAAPSDSVAAALGLLLLGAGLRRRRRNDAFRNG
jgi:MYXO-CTERM domain-containing protein